jgi:RIO kinase 1
MYKAGVVHGDLSEYNILNWDEKPCIIDLSMGVLTDHPIANDLLERDVDRVLNYFRKMGVKDEENRTAYEIIQWIKSGPKE